MTRAYRVLRGALAAFGAFMGAGVAVSLWQIHKDAGR